jgi:tRNA pseudouridine38/39 synthase
MCRWKPLYAWRTLVQTTEKRQATRSKSFAAQTRKMSEESPDYTTWSQQELIQRVNELEQKLSEQIRLYELCFSSSTSRTNYQLSYASQPLVVPSQPLPRIESLPEIKKPKLLKLFDPSKHNTRFIALKFAYLGSGYNGLEHHAGNLTPFPTVEEELWKALVRTRLIFPPSLAANGLFAPDPAKLMDNMKPGEMPVDWEGCRYSKCGRTDRGVSAFGQVIAMRVRASKDGEPDLRYLSLLNRVLPPTIRALAWCPNPPANFDARFSCKEREYRYFFTSPAYVPLPGAGTDKRTLNIEAMAEAASYLLGTHDFRNFCKIDGSKQMTEFNRKINHASVDLVSNLSDPKLDHAKVDLYAFKIRGSAFLWHQVRCMVAILFLVGQGLEKPSLVKELLDVETCPSRPVYDMASDQPLVLWDCKFSKTYGKLEDKDTADRPLYDRGEGEDELDWIYAGEFDGQALDNKWARIGIMEQLWSTWRGYKMEEILASQLIELVAKTGRFSKETGPLPIIKTTRVFSGDDSVPNKGNYESVMKRPRLEHFGIINDRYNVKNRTKASD